MMTLKMGVVLLLALDVVNLKGTKSSSAQLLPKSPPVYGASLGGAVSGVQMNVPPSFCSVMPPLFRHPSGDTLTWSGACVNPAARGVAANALLMARMAKQQIKTILAKDRGRLERIVMLLGQCGVF